MVLWLLLRLVFAAMNPAEQGPVRTQANEQSRDSPRTEETIQASGGRSFIIQREPVWMQEDEQPARERYWNSDRVGGALLLIPGLAAVVLGIVAEVYNSKDSLVMIIDGECVYLGDSYHVVLGVAGGLSLLVAQVLITIVSCCQSFPQRSPASILEGAAVKYLVGSWLTFFIAFYYFMAGVLVRARNEHHQTAGHAYCSVVIFLVYTKAAVLAFVTMAETHIYYMALCEARTMAKASYTEIRQNDVPAHSVSSIV